MISSYELISVQGDFLTADALCWRRYRCYAPGILEILLDVNPHLAKLHKTSPFLPVGTQVRIPIDTDILRGAPVARSIIKLWNVG
jgi:phage tail protein X